MLVHRYLGTYGLMSLGFGISNGFLGMGGGWRNGSCGHTFEGSRRGTFTILISGSECSGTFRNELHSFSFTCWASLKTSVWRTATKFGFYKSPSVTYWASIIHNNYTPLIYFHMILNIPCFQTFLYRTFREENILPNS